MRLILITALATVWAADALAQQPLSAEVLLDRLVGGSAVFTRAPDGGYIGREYFPSRNRSFWEGADGTCSEGRVTIEGQALCFRYEGAPDEAHCWVPFVDGDRMAYTSTTTEEVQWITPVPDLPFDCVDGNLTS
ncbi:hypothetical protein JANAI62_13370 [Jannaschia pagri]|uniref:Uncharacterized protein n=1 Tax=Jannaschia pagri TaxID=2829797 RepID=A0ABQ4NJZ9_9RHOB|nr:MULTISPECIES: hypothetical protein [unclassified Jannaschia]GIT90883.1 hypothetical protein JANAI61_13410 [Jannaschia sp. AI_61]GIT94714.1 hypothetical protein JANAI62_13370 [Jannaschia sp. AI_62]